MKDRMDREIWVGVLVLALGTGVMGGVYGFRAVEGEGNDGYAVVARFNRSDGLVRGAEVRLAGVPVGRVRGHVLSEHYQVAVTLHMAAHIVLPEDSAAAIHSDGLLGPKFIEILPGGSERAIPPGGTMRYTQDAILLDDLLERILARVRMRATGGNEGRERRPAAAVMVPLEQ
ncbi:MAG: ABC-type transport system involved in resistance to organic solvent periplasmic component [Rhodospirillaceae bacterium]|nr:MAG: ABC-type transport system involved in resistance to organic solvent periplasmic component [Rhodospirillaceae bacterium]